VRTLYQNGRVLTVDPACPEAEAFVVDGERFAGIGSRNDLAGLLGPGDRTVDLGGRTVVPGLIDAHVHFSWFSYLLGDVNLDGVDSLEAALAQVRDRMARTPGGGWIRGHGFNANLWERWPTARDLDMVAPCHPVVLTSKDGHSLWCNSLVLRMAGVTAATEDLPGGQILRDEHGAPAGIFQENASDLIWPVVPERTNEEMMAALRQGIVYAHGMGVTGVHCMDGVDCFRGLQGLQARGELNLRVFKSIPQQALDGALAAGLATGYGDEWLRVGNLKLFSDGSLGSQTAYMLDSFEGRPGYLGVPTQSPESLRVLIGKAVAGNISVAVHAIGDAANRMVLDALAEVAEPSRRQGLRHRIEHAQLLTEADIPRFADLGVIASVQPSHAPSDRYVADKFWGERSQLAYAFRDLLASGARLAFGSDVPVEPLDPLAGIHAAVWRKRVNEPESASWYPEQRLTVAEALHGLTLGAAYASGEERLKGSITAGKLADFVVLSHDISGGDSDENVLRAVRAEATVVGGRLVFGEC
jgi:predicted amidohydrolase YtcJ